MTTITTPPTLERPSYHVWMASEPGGDPVYHGVVTILNADQLTAETQAKGLGIKPQEQPFHLTNLWIWAAMVRTNATTERFRPFTQLVEYRPVKDDDTEEVELDPTLPAPGPSTA